MARPPQTFILALSIALSLPLTTIAAQAEPAQTEPAVADAAETNAATAKDATSGFEDHPYQLQRLDEPAHLLDPTNPRTVQMEQQATATAWYMTGRLHQQRDRFTEAMEAYEKAAKLAPTNVDIVRAKIQVALELNQPGKALQYVIDTVKLDPDDYQLLRQLGLKMHDDQQNDLAVKYLEQARDSSRLKKTTPFYVLINRDLGIVCSRIGEIEKAADAFEIVLSALISPQNFGLGRRVLNELRKQQEISFERIGQVLLRAGRTDTALTALDRAFDERNGKPGGINYLLAQVYFQKEQYDESLKQIDIFFDSQLIRGRAPYALLKQVLTKLGKKDTLATRLETLAKIDPTNKDVRFFLAEQYVSVDRLKDAEAIYKTALEDEPSVQAYMGLAQIYRRQKKADDFLDSISKVYVRNWKQSPLPEPLATELQVIQKDKDLQDELLTIVRDQTRDGAHANHFGKLMVVAQILEGAERPDDAAEMYRLAITANPAMSSDVYQTLGTLFMTLDRYVEAAAVYREAAGKPLLQGSKPNNLLLLALSLELAGETNAALEAMAEAKATIPKGHFLLDFREAWIYYHARRMTKAAELYEAFIENHPTQVTLTRQARISLSSIYIHLGDMKKGEGILEKFLAENPDDVGVNNDLGYLYADQGKHLKKARKMIELAVKAEPENAAFLDSMGWVLFKLGETKEAIEWLQKATKLENGDDATIWEHLGDCHVSLKETSDAKTAWDKALKLAKADTRQDQDLINRIEEKLAALKADKGTIKTETSKDP